jgi:ubiquinone/menaquinone biosynthesis C-methylase UbiE
MDKRTGDASQMTKLQEQIAVPSTAGNVLHYALRYDLLVWLVSLGKERAYRENTLNLARLKSGESVLDVGCGTGTLAIAAKRRVGPTGSVYGIDASPEMIARARKKAAKAAVEVTFENAAVQKLPFPDARFDAVLSTTMLHHLSEEARRRCMSEIRRVLRPGGRLLAIDFGGPANARRSWVSHFHHHRTIDLRQMIPMMTEAGLNSVESGPVRRSFGMVGDLHFVLAETSTRT